MDQITPEIGDLLKAAFRDALRNPRVFDQLISARVVALAATEPEAYIEDVADADNRARELLGLTVYEAGRLFDPLNTLDDLRRLVGEMNEAVTR
ncbi:MAG: hypothetical protein JWO67_2050 [Streptosporangiaceae bacterium]|nr:hypothetical protein [Streptosporangiaceae bacterium]